MGPLSHGTGVWSQAPSVLRLMYVNVATKDRQTQLLNLSPLSLWAPGPEFPAHRPLPPPTTLLEGLLCLWVDPEEPRFIQSPPPCSSKHHAAQRGHEELDRPFCAARLQPISTSDTFCSIAFPHNHGLQLNPCNELSIKPRSMRAQFPTDSSVQGG